MYVNKRASQVVLGLSSKNEVQQVIVNLVGNAFEAMEEIDRPPLLQICIRRIEDDRVLTEFIDNGRGLPVDSVDDIFDAFVTTKKNGVGIGLAISHSIVEAQVGSCWQRKTRILEPSLASF